MKTVWQTRVNRRDRIQARAPEQGFPRVANARRAVTEVQIW